MKQYFIYLFIFSFINICSENPIPDDYNYFFNLENSKLSFKDIRWGFDQIDGPDTIEKVDWYMCKIKYETNGNTLYFRFKNSDPNDDIVPSDINLDFAQINVGLWGTTFSSGTNFYEHCLRPQIKNLNKVPIVEFFRTFIAKPYLFNRVNKEDIHLIVIKDAEILGDQRLSNLSFILWNKEVKSEKPNFLNSEDFIELELFDNITLVNHEKNTTIQRSEDEEDDKENSKKQQSDFEEGKNENTSQKSNSNGKNDTGFKYTTSSKINENDKKIWEDKISKDFDVLISKSIEFSNNFKKLTINCNIHPFSDRKLFFSKVQKEKVSFHINPRELKIKIENLSKEYYKYARHISFELRSDYGKQKLKYLRNEDKLIIPEIIKLSDISVISSKPVKVKSVDVDSDANLITVFVKDIGYNSFDDKTSAKRDWDAHDCIPLIKWDLQDIEISDCLLYAYADLRVYTKKNDHFSSQDILNRKLEIGISNKKIPLSFNCNKPEFCSIGEIVKKCVTLYSGKINLKYDIDEGNILYPNILGFQPDISASFSEGYDFIKFNRFTYSGNQGFINLELITNDKVDLNIRSKSNLKITDYTVGLSCNGIEKVNGENLILLEDLLKHPDVEYKLKVSHTHYETQVITFSGNNDWKIIGNIKLEPIIIEFTPNFILMDNYNNTAISGEKPQSSQINRPQSEFPYLFKLDEKDKNNWIFSNNKESIIINLEDISYFNKVDLKIKRRTELRSFKINLKEKPDDINCECFVTGYLLSEYEEKKMETEDNISFQAQFPIKILNGDKIDVKIIKPHGYNILFKNENKNFELTKDLKLVTFNDHKKLIKDVYFYKIPTYDFFYIDISNKGDYKRQMIDFLAKNISSIVSQKYDYFLFLSNYQSPKIADRKKDYEQVLGFMNTMKQYTSSISNDISIMSDKINKEKIIPERKICTFHFFFSEVNYNKENLEKIFGSFMHEFGSDYKKIRIKIYHEFNLKYKIEDVVQNCPESISYIDITKNF